MGNSNGWGGNDVGFSDPSPGAGFVRGGGVGTGRATPDSRRLGVVALDNHPLVIEGVLRCTQRDDTVEWMGAATTWQGLQDVMLSLPRLPDVALVDVALGDGTVAVGVVRQLSWLGVTCVAMAAELRPVPIRRTLRAGAVGLLLKADAPSSVMSVLGDVRHGKEAMSSDTARAVATDPRMAAELTAREVEVLELLAKGYTRRQVARVCTPPIAESTVATHVERVFDAYREMGRSVNSTVDAVREATVDGYLTIVG